VKTIPVDASVGESLNTLVREKISGAPLVDEDGDAYGTIDMLDIVCYLGKKLNPRGSKSSIDENQVKEFLEKYPIIYLADISGRNAWHSIPYQKSLKKGIRLLSNPNIHRVWLTDHDGLPCGVVTQRQLVEFLLTRGGDKLNPITTQKIVEIIPSRSRIISIGINDLLIDAFKKMDANDVSGMPVVDSDGNLIGNISVTDLKYLDFRDKLKAIKDLFSPIGEFFTKLPRMRIIAVRKDESLLDAMEGAIKHKVHRVYVLNEDDKLYSVISLSDIIAQFNLW